MVNTKWHSFNKRSIGYRFLLTISIVFLFTVQFNYFENSNSIFRLPSINVLGESGAPPENGTSDASWIIEPYDVISRENEVIETKRIEIEEFGKLNWNNITAHINNSLDVKSDGELNFADCDIKILKNLNCSGNISWERVNAELGSYIDLTSSGDIIIKNSTLILTGDIMLKGKLTLINCSLQFNCSYPGEFFFAVEDTAELIILNGSIISVLQKNMNLRVLWVSKTSRFKAEDSMFSNIGYNNKFSGITVESNGTIIKNCWFNNSISSITFLDNSGSIINNCTFQNSTVGLDIINSDYNQIENCKFHSLENGIFSTNSSHNYINKSLFWQVSKYGLKFETKSNFNVINNSKIKDSKLGGIAFGNDSNNNLIFNCTIKNSNGSGIQFYNGTINTLVKNCTLNNNTFNLICNDYAEDIALINNSLQNPGTFDMKLTNSSDVLLVNTTYDSNKIWVDENSYLTTQWFIHIIVQNYSRIPVPSAKVTIMDNENDTNEITTKSDRDGRLNWLVLTQHYINNQTIINLTPYTAIAEIYEYQTNLSLTFNRSTTFNLTFNEIFRLDPDLLPNNITFSNSYPLRNETITISSSIINIGISEFNNSIANVSVYFYVDDLLINYSRNLRSLLDGEYEILETSWRVNVTNGTHTVYVVVDPEGNLSEMSENNNILMLEIIVNSVPIPKLTIEPDEALTFTRITMDARESFNKVKLIPINAYLYDFGDGKNSGWTDNSTTTYEYNDDGTYFLRLKVQDLSGQESKWSEPITLTIKNRAPIASFQITPTSGNITTRFKFNPDSSMDLDGTVSKFYWEFSDGFNSTARLATHSFNDDTSYTIQLTVWDDDGKRSETTLKTLKILNTPPEVTFFASTQHANVKDVIVFNASGTIDIDDELESLDYTWDFGDGTFGYNLSIIEHNYSKPGNYNVTLYVKDGDGDRGSYVLSINVSQPELEEPVPTDASSDLSWLWMLLILIIVVFIIIILLIYITQSKKLRKYDQSQEALSTGSGKDEDVSGSKSVGSQFTTAGKLDFVIMKRAIGKRYMKFELHRTTQSKTEFVGIIWKSAYLDKSWQIEDNIRGSLEKVSDTLQIKILAQRSKNWNIDYSGNGKILPKNLPLDKDRKSETNYTPPGQSSKQSVTSVLDSLKDKDGKVEDEKNLKR